MWLKQTQWVHAWNKAANEAKKSPIVLQADISPSVAGPIRKVAKEKLLARKRSRVI